MRPRARLAAATAVAAVCSLALSAPSLARHRYAGRWGGVGAGLGHFGAPRAEDTMFRLRKSPTGIAVDRDGTVWVADPGNVRIDHFTGRGRYLGGFGRYGLRPGGLHRPEGLLVGPGRRLDVVSNGNDRVDRFTRGGRFRGVFNVARWLSLRYGLTRGAGRGQLSNPYGIARGRHGSFFVADLDSARVNRYDVRGRGHGQIGSFGTKAGRFLAPFGVAVDPAGNVWVSDRDLNRLQKFTPSGRLLRIVGRAGSARGELLSPQGLATDRRGRVYVADTVNRRIQVFSPRGAFVESFGHGRLREPDYIAVDRHCNVWVTDYRRVVHFAAQGGCG